MSENRSKIMLVALAVAESTWLFALLAVIGLALGLGEAAMPWLAVFGLMFAAVLVGSLFAGVEGDNLALAMSQAALALVFIYLFMGAGPYVENATFDAGWIVRLTTGQLDGGQVVNIIIAFIVSVWIWRHGLKLASDPYPQDRLSTVFKIGIGVLAVAVLVDQAVPEDLGAGTLLIPFFAATLIGMAVGRLPEQGFAHKGREWARMIAVSVFVIMGLGLLLGLLGGLYGSGGVRLLYAGWGLAVDAVLWALRYPIMWIVWLMQWILSLFPEREDPETETGAGGLSAVEILGIEPDELTEQGPSLIDAIVNILQYPVIAILVILTFVALTLAFRKFGQRRDTTDDGERESIRGDASVAGDLARLLSGMVPRWLRGKRTRDWIYPQSGPTAPAFHLYFQTLTMGIKWGMTFHPHQTPTERVPLLQAALPGAPVSEVTAHFNAACYGEIGADAGLMESLGIELMAAERRLKGD